jgi:WD40 repeat protein
LGHRDRIQHPRTFTGHSDLVTSVTFLPDMPQGSSRSRFSADGRTALSGRDDETLKLWDLTTDC